MIYFTIRRCQIPCKVLKGVKKGIRDWRSPSSPDAEVESSNAVYIGEQWWFVDPFMASPYSRISSMDREESQALSKKNMDDEQNHIAEPDDFFFLINPKEYIYFHWSMETKWQLLDIPLSREEFDSLASVGTHFFELGMSLCESSKGWFIYPTYGETTLTFGLPKDKAFTHQFEYRFFQRAQQDNEIDTLIKQWPSFVQQHQRCGLLAFTVRFPYTGEYMLEIYATTTDALFINNPSKFLAIYAFMCSDTYNLPPFRDSINDNIWSTGYLFHTQSQTEDFLVTAVHANDTFEKGSMQLHQDINNANSMFIYQEQYSAENLLSADLAMPGTNLMKTVGESAEDLLSLDEAIEDVNLWETVGKSANDLLSLDVAVLDANLQETVGEPTEDVLSFDVTMCSANLRGIVRESTEAVNVVLLSYDNETLDLSLQPGPFANFGTSFMNRSSRFTYYILSYICNSKL